MGNDFNVQAFMKMPKILFKDVGLKTLSVEAKVLYMLFLDRLSLSRANGWSDQYNRLYIIYSVDSVREDIGCGKNKALRILKELESASLIERVKRWKNLTDLIYVNELVKEDAKESEGADCDDTVVSNGCSSDRDVDNCVDKPLENGLGGLKNKPQGVSKSNPNKTEFNNTECKYICDRYMDKDARARTDIHTAKEAIKKQIGYGKLCSDREKDFRGDKRLRQNFCRELDEIVEGIAEVYFMRDDSNPINIGGKIYPVQYVKYRYSQLCYDTVSYVLYCVGKSKSRIKNIKKYMMAVLFNAGSTIESYWQAEVRADQTDMRASFRQWLKQRYCGYGKSVALNLKI